MPPLLAEWAAVRVDVELSRDYEPAAARVAGMALGTHRLAGQWTSVASELYQLGARHARIPDPVDLCRDASAGSARTLVLIRELTAHGIAVEWLARCLDGCVATNQFSHLYPPARVDGTTDEAPARHWRESFFLCKCVFRRGPGFLEVRDRRSDSLEMFTIDEPEHLATINAMIEGVASDRVPAGVRRDLAGADLIAEQAGHLWWLPMRAYRWPFPALIV